MEVKEDDKCDISKMIEDAYNNGYKRGYSDAMYRISKEADKLNVEMQSVSLSLYTDSIKRKISKMNSEIRKQNFE